MYLKVKHSLLCYQCNGSRLTLIQRRDFDQCKPKTETKLRAWRYQFKVIAPFCPAAFKRISYRKHFEFFVNQVISVNS